jgi:DNA-binding HxlR family transcriptional regulator
MNELFEFLMRLIRGKWTGRIILHFHQGVLKKTQELKDVKI